MVALFHQRLLGDKDHGAMGPCDEHKVKRANVY